MDWLRVAAVSRPGAPALVTPDRTVTYGELDRAADAVAPSSPGAVSPAAPSPSGAARSGHGGGDLGSPGRYRHGPYRFGWRRRERRLTAKRTPVSCGRSRRRVRRCCGLTGLEMRPAGCPVTPGSSSSLLDRRETQEAVLTGGNVTALDGRIGRETRQLATTHGWCAALFHVGVAVLWRQAAAAPVLLEPSFDAVLVPVRSRTSFASVVPRCSSACSMQEPAASAAVGGGAAGPRCAPRRRRRNPLQTWDDRDLLPDLHRRPGDAGATWGPPAAR